MAGSASPIDRKLMRAMNQNTLLNLIRVHAPVSRTQLIALSGLSSGTVVSIIRELLEQQLIVEQGTAESNVGRKAGLLELHPQGGYVIGLGLVEEETITMTLLNLSGEVVFSESWEAALRGQGAVAIQSLATEVASLLNRSGIPRHKILGLGCGFPGYVSAPNGRVVDDWIHLWHDLAVAPMLSQALKMPVYIDNIVNCLGCYEHLFGNGKQYQHFLVVTLGRGIGLAMVINGEIYRGAQGGGGEFGHIPSIPGGRLCECGKRGCLEAYISDQGLLASYYELCLAYPDDPRIAPGLSLSQLRVAVQQEDSPLCQIFTQAGHLLGCGLATLVNLLNPECIILTGPSITAKDILFDAMSNSLHKQTFSQLGDQLQLIIEPVTETCWAQGAGSLVLRRFFSSPLQV
jgi:N-acetylglucosamine repressor